MPVNIVLIKPEFRHRSVFHENKFSVASISNISRNLLFLVLNRVF